ncbi:hypothetical protein [Homoserinimonas hongtaonis]|uniref:hypothetical protein n=1 Tax=Homoserinimonas hongtaonis TaxID=2079791 RepID=UPI0018EE68F0|nr:hypothetical protein [Salinibacterium hongtaonis]
MYAALWRLLPGPLWVRIVCAVAIVALVLLILVLWVFPWVNSFISVPEVTVQ